MTPIIFDKKLKIRYFSSFDGEHWEVEMNPWRFCVTFVLAVAAGIGCYLAPQMAAESSNVVVETSITTVETCPAVVEPTPIESPREVVVPLPVPEVGHFPVLAQKRGGVVEEDTAMVLDTEWVDVMNVEPVSNANATFRGPNDKCRIHVGGTLRVLSVIEEMVAVEYTAVEYGAGTRCPSGVIFWMQKEKFAGMPMAYAEAMKSQRLQKKLPRE